MISFGSDPEFALLKNGKLHSAIGVVQGTSDNRISLKGHEFYYDNVMAECAVKPAWSREEAVENVRECLKIYAKMVVPFRLADIASATYPKSQLSHPHARVAGCSPDYNAYDMKLLNQPAEQIRASSFRSCGGHIHIGHSLLQSDDHRPLLAIYMLDLFIGVPSIWLDDNTESVERRKLYGKAGTYRPKDYGLEYRSLSNFWLNNPELVTLMYDLCEFVVGFVENGQADNFWTFDEEVFYNSDQPSDAWTCSGYDVRSLRSGIDRGDKTLLDPHLALAKSLMPATLRMRLETASSRKKKSMYEEWGLDR